MPRPQQSFPWRCFLVLVTTSPRAEVSCRRWWCWDGEAEPIRPDPGEAQVRRGGQRTDRQWYSELACFCGFKPVLMLFEDSFLSVNIYNSVKTPGQLVMHFEVC